MSVCLFLFFLVLCVFSFQITRKQMLLFLHRNRLQFNFLIIFLRIEIYFMVKHFEINLLVTFKIFHIAKIYVIKPICKSWLTWISLTVSAQIETCCCAFCASPVSRLLTEELKLKIWSWIIPFCRLSVLTYVISM